MPVFIKVTPNDPLYKRLKHTRTDAFKFFNQAQNADGTPYDYTGHTFTMEVKKYKGAATQEVLIPNDNFTLDQSTEGQAAGVFDIFRITHPAADFAALPADPFEHYFDIQVTDATGEPFTPILGDFIIRDD